MQQQQMMNTGPPPSPSGAIPPTIQWVVAPPQQPPQPNYTYPHRLSVQLGVTLIICGILSIIFNIVDLAISTNGYDEYDDYYYYSSLGFVGHGFWSGLMCVVAGILGVVAGRTRTTCMIRASMTLSILAACFALGQLATSLTGAAFLGSFNLEDDCCTGCHYHDYYYGRDNGNCRKVQTLIAMESLLALMSLIGGICAIVLSSMGCRAACCCRQTVVYSGYPMTCLPGGIQVTNMSQQQGPQTAGYPYQYPVTAYGPPAGAGYQYPPPPPSYNPVQSTRIGDEDKHQQLLQ
jgi:hypothetical protein